MPQKDFNVSYLRKFKLTDQVEIKPLTEIIELIRNGSHETIDNQWNFRRTGNVSFKHKMPAIIWTGETNKREDSAVLNTNGLMAVDYDKVFTAERFELLSQRAKSDPSVVTAFTTPHGQFRYKIVFLTDVSDASIYKTAYQLLLERLAEDDIFGQFEPDPSNSNVSRCHFVPFDPNVYYNPDAIPIELDSMAKGVPYFSHYKAPISESREYLVLVLDKILEYYRKIRVTSVVIDGNGSKWIGTVGGLAVYNENGIPFSVRENIIIEHMVKVYPNSTSSQITISTPTTPDKNTFMTIMDITGKEVLVGELTHEQTVVDVSGLPQGVYFIRVADDRTVQVGKFVKR